MLFKKRGAFTEEDAEGNRVRKSEARGEGDNSHGRERYRGSEEEAVGLREGGKAHGDLTGEEREVRIEILEGYVSDKIRGVDVDEL